MTDLPPGLPPGLPPAAQVKDALLPTGLPRESLRAVWELSDIDKVRPRCVLLTHPKCSPCHQPLLSSSTSFPGSPHPLLHLPS